MERHGVLCLVIAETACIQRANIASIVEFVRERLPVAGHAVAVMCGEYSGYCSPLRYRRDREITISSSLALAESPSKDHPDALRAFSALQRRKCIVDIAFRHVSALVIG